MHDDQQGQWLRLEFSLKAVFLHGYMSGQIVPRPRKSFKIAESLNDRNSKQGALSALYVFHKK